RRTGKTASRPCARLDQTLEAEPQGEAVAAHRDAVNRRGVAFFLRRDVAGGAGIEAERADDFLAVLELELLLDRLAVPRRCRNIDDAAGVGHAEVAEEDAGRARAPRERGQDRIAFAQAARRQVLHFLLPLH